MSRMSRTTDPIPPTDTRDRHSGQTLATLNRKGCRGGCCDTSGEVLAEEEGKGLTAKPLASRMRWVGPAAGPRLLAAASYLSVLVPRQSALRRLGWRYESAQDAVQFLVGAAELNDEPLALRAQQRDLALALLQISVVLADVELDDDLAPGVAHVVAGRHGLLFVFAIGERATWRLLATRPDAGPPPSFGQPGPPVPAGELQTLLDDSGLGVQITGLAWSGRVRVQHRLADRYRRGPLFLSAMPPTPTPRPVGRG